MNEVKQIEWSGCYDGSWDNVIVPEAFSHPAKFARGLIQRIYAHLFETGRLAPGSIVVDPFGGVALGGLDAMTGGAHWIGCELEPKFHALAERNIEQWKYWIGWDRLPGIKGSARIVQGDSRRLCELLGPVMADCVKKQNSYTTATAIISDKGGSDDIQSQASANQPGRVASDVPCSGVINCRDRNSAEVQPSERQQLHAAMGHSQRQEKEEAKDQVGSEEVRNRVSVLQSEHESGADSGLLRHSSGHDLPSDETSRDQDVFQGAEGTRASQLQERQIETRLPNGNHEGQVPEMWDDRGSGNPPQERRSLRQPAGESGSPLQLLPHEHHEEEVVGCKEGRSTNSKKQLTDGVGTQAEEAADLVLSSPPYEGCPVLDSPRGTAGCASGGIGTQYRLGNRPRGAARKADGSTADGYGTTPGQLGHTEGDTFWTAARAIVEQCYAILRPGGCAVWVCKDFVRAKARVPFSADLVRLCEACGFRLVEWIKASLVKRVQEDSLFGGMEEKTTERKSFFRRLAEKKGSPRIDEEDVLVMVKTGAGGAADAVVSSPPYAESVDSRSEADREADRRHRKRIGRNPHSAGSLPVDEYGRTDGQLGAMPPGEIADALVSSPPFLFTEGGSKPPVAGWNNSVGCREDINARHAGAQKGGYGHTDGQLGDMPHGDIADAM